MEITIDEYLRHKRGRTDFPSSEQYVENGVAAEKRAMEWSSLVETVVVAPGSTIGQIFTDNPTLDRQTICKAVAGKYDVIGYRAGWEVYGTKKPERCT